MATDQGTDLELTGYTTEQLALIRAEVERIAREKAEHRQQMLARQQSR